MLSILIPAYNAERFITPAVLSATRQTDRHPVEILVCDDGSTDNTARELHALKQQVTSLRVLSHRTNRGVSAARNTLVANVHQATKYVAFFDADDMYVDGALGRSIRLLEESPRTDITLGRMRVVRSSALEDGELVAEDWPVLHGVTLSASVIRRHLVSKVGTFNEGLSHGEDLDYLIRIAELSDARLLHDDVVFYYRRHGTNATGDVKALRRGFMHAMLLHARRRAADPTLRDISGLVPEMDPKIREQLLSIDR